MNKVTSRVLLKKGYKRYTIKICGVKLFADYKTGKIKGFNQSHIEFHSMIPGKPIPISETGYLSQFTPGSLKKGVDVKKAIQDLANLRFEKDVVPRLTEKSKVRVKFIEQVEMYCVTYLKGKKQIIKWLSTKLQANELANEIKDKKK